MKKPSAITLGLIAAPILIVALILWSVLQPKPGESVVSQGNQHIETTSDEHQAYNTTPPTSGPHVGSMARWGVHEEQIEDELQIHNLEDGGVIVHYTSDVGEDVVDELESIVRSYSDSVILEPYNPMQSPIVLTAWGRIEYLDTYDEERIRSFISAYRGIDHHAR